jgi:hypothetical protein
MSSPPSERRATASAPVRAEGKGQPEREAKPAIATGRTRRRPAGPGFTIITGLSGAGRS